MCTLKINDVEKTKEDIDEFTEQEMRELKILAEILSNLVIKELENTENEKE